MAERLNGSQRKRAKLICVKRPLVGSGAKARTRGRHAPPKALGAADVKRLGQSGPRQRRRTYALWQRDVAIGSGCHLSERSSQHICQSQINGLHLTTRGLRMGDNFTPCEADCSGSRLYHRQIVCDNGGGRQKREHTPHTIT